MELLVSFVLSVMASVVAYYICKWLDGDKKWQSPAWRVSPLLNKRQNPLESGFPRGAFFVYAMCIVRYAYIIHSNFRNVNTHFGHFYFMYSLKAPISVSISSSVPLSKHWFCGDKIRQCGKKTHISFWSQEIGSLLVKLSWIYYWNITQTACYTKLAAITYFIRYNDKMIQ